jgi:lipopolysaccharide export system protein LptA
MFFCLLLVMPRGELIGKDWKSKNNIVDRDLPIQITSDRMDAYDDKGMVVFDGNAVAIQGERTITANTITLFYKKKPEGSGPLVATEGPKNGDLDKIEAKGNVRITQGERIVTGKEAIFLQDEQKIIVKGNAVLKEGKNEIRGAQVVVYLNENRGVVESGPGERVNAIYTPAGKKETKP